LAHSDDLQLGACFRVTQRIKAGDDVSQGLPLPAGCAARIFTGAPILQGANTVVMQEDCDVSTLEEGEQIQLKSVPAKGQWIRRAGEDVNCGATVLVSGTRLSPAELGLAASVGMSKLCVAKQPRVALFSTGDELVMPGAVRPADMKPGSIFNSNRFFLKALLTRMGCVVTDLGVVPDRYDATVQALSDAALQHDLIVTSGGVSVGEEDHVKPAVQSLGRLHLWQISMKPGKPFAFGQIAQSYFVGLPGNPVSSFMTFLLLVRPLIQKLQGAPDPSKLAVQPTMMRADFEVGRADKRREFLRVKRNSAGGLDLFPNQSSGVLTSAVWGDGVVDKPAGQTIQRGDWVAYLPFSEFMR
jgi:molybdopterin molybdotransferase